MNWEQVCADPNLQNLPYKIELNKWGQIVMSPASIRHVIFQNRITKLLQKFLNKGETFQEFPIETSENVKAPDAVWMSEELFEQVRENVSSPIAPEICIEVMSPGNTKQQMLYKGQLYFEKGAQEFWMCDGNGEMEFYNSEGQLEHSALVHDFPGKVEI
ncbi:MAG: Uma2 family endonuclease [bacterium]|nr:Uma2 family endonuclease [bacterium]